VLETYTERGGLRWGYSFWNASNATWPFARLSCTRTELRLIVAAGGPDARFQFARADVDVVHRVRGVLSVGAAIEHSRKGYPPTIIFWTCDYPRLRDKLKALGYDAY
jgi:hypothetical protein